MTLILKAVEFDKTSAAFRKKFAGPEALVDAGWLIQPKYDGVFGMAVMQADIKDCRMLTRTGEVVRSCDHIVSELWHRHRPDVHGDYVMLGELWTNGVPQPTISGWARKHTPAPNLGFVVNDVLPIGLEDFRPYSARLAALRAIFGMSWSLPWTPGVYAVGTLTSLAHPGEGYDGVILRDPGAVYRVGLARNGEIVKVKPTLTLDLQVVGINSGEGKHAGTMGALIVSYRGVWTRVGTGFSDAERAEWYARWKCGKLFTRENGKMRIVEVEAMAVTDAGALREPRYKGERFDKDQAD